MGAAGTDWGSQRILLVAPNFPPKIGGAQRWAYDIAVEFHRMNQAVMVAAPTHPDAPAFDRGLPFEVERYPTFGDGMAWSAIPALMKLRRRFNPTAVLAGHWSGAHAGLRAFGRRVPVVSAVHGREVALRPMAHFAPGQMIYDMTRRHVFRHAAAFACVSRFTRDLMREAGVADERLHVVPNGVDGSRFRVNEGDGFRARHGLGGKPMMLTVARLVPRKGVASVIAAMPEILKQVPGLVYAVVGTGPESNELQALAQKLGVSQHVWFTGEIGEQDLVGAYQACDIFIMPARQELPEVEGFGLVFLEAGACRKPVIASPTGGIPDAVIDGRTGLFVPPDRPDAIAAASIRILGNPEFALTLGRTGKAFALKCMTWQRAARQLLRILATAGENDDHKATAAVALGASNVK